MEINTLCVVIGAGSAGYGATIAALRDGCSVLLAERHGFPGGMGTVSGISSYINYKYHGEDLSESVYRALRKDIFEADGGYLGDGEHVDFFDVEVSKRIMENHILRMGGKLLYHSLLRTISRDAGGWILRFACKGATVLVRARFVIDATGDADACTLAGAGYTHGRNGDGKTQPMSMIVQVGGFEPEKWAESGGKLIHGRYACGGDCFSGEIAQARAEGYWNIPRENIAMWWAMPKNPTHITINGSRLLGYDACNPFDVTAAEIEGRKQAGVIASFFKRYIPGFANSHILSTGPQIGVRESRRIVGLRTLTEQDIAVQRQPDDMVVRCAYPIDIHSPDNAKTNFDKVNGELLYGIPYGCLLPEGLENMAAAGRCISASHEAAGSFRVMPTCMAIGEAAGVAVALAHRQGIMLSEVDPRNIRDRLDEALGK
ncbi:FAD-dependent oxidoreductase [Termitidicoccus mucosus]